MRWTSLIVAIAVAVVDILYIGTIRAQPGPPSDQPWIVPFIAGYILLMAICAALAAWIRAEPWPGLLLGAATGGLLLLGYFGLFSIGLPLLVAGLVMLAALIARLRPATHPRRMAGTAIAGGLAAVLILLGGFDLTQRIIVCQPGVQGGGGGGGFLAGPYSYTCQNGRATVHNGH